jgi:excisionase family DNA binding protein
MPFPKAFNSLEDVAERYDVSIRTVRRWIKKGDLIAHRFGHQYRVSAVDLETFERLRREG